MKLDKPTAVIAGAAAVVGVLIIEAAGLPLFYEGTLVAVAVGAIAGGIGRLWKRRAQAKAQR